MQALLPPLPAPMRTLRDKKRVADGRSKQCLCRARLWVIFQAVQQNAFDRLWLHNHVPTQDRAPREYGHLQCLRGNGQQEVILQVGDVFEKNLDPDQAAVRARGGFQRT